MDSNLEVSTTNEDHDDEIEPNEEVCSSHIMYNQQAKNPNVIFDNPVIAIHSSTDDQDV